MLCEGTITRKRMTTVRTEESVISHVLVSEDLVQKSKAVQIDEKGNMFLQESRKLKMAVSTRKVITM